MKYIVHVPIPRQVNQLVFTVILSQANVLKSRNNVVRKYTGCVCVNIGGRFNQGWEQRDKEKAEGGGKVNANQGYMKKPYGKPIFYKLI